ncbi:terminase small subunit [Rhodococcus erythropolis]
MEEQTPQEEKNKGGRPLKYQTVEELDLAIQNYFAECDPHTTKALVETGRDGQGNMLFDTRTILTEQKPYTVSGLARALGIDRDTLVNYKKRDEYFGSVSAAYARCHEYAESQLYGRSATGAAFSLKNNWGWKDRQELTGAEGAPLMPIGLDSAILARMQDRGETPPVTTEDSGE